MDEWLMRIITQKGIFSFGKLVKIKAFCALFVSVILNPQPKTLKHYHRIAVANSVIYVKKTDKLFLTRCVQFSAIKRR